MFLPETVIYNTWQRISNCDKMELSISRMKEMIKNQGDKRVSEDAAEELGQILELFAGDLAEESVAVAEEDGRKTVRGEDVKKALK
ncbi:MAG: histone [Nanohaloarchaea archaeon QH_8_44_6]|nr:MAG: histone [Nanohaloarchaea archaeon QH_8_44_6]